MDTTSTPLKEPFGIEVCLEPPQGILQLSNPSNHLNHLRSIGASAVFALAEASSNAFLLQNTNELEIEDYILNLRRSEIKFRGSSSGRIYSIGKYAEREWKRFHRALVRNNKSLIVFPIHIMNESGKCVAVAEFEWFVFRKPQRQEFN